MTQRRLFLASSSPRRKQILEEAGIPFSCIPNLLEHEPERASDISPETWVAHLAELKAKASAQNHHGLICGSDTMVVFNNVDYGKPKDAKQAAEFLSQLAGQTHQVHTAVAVLDTLTSECVTAVDTVDVTMNPLSPEQIQVYIQQYDVLDKAGAYGIQHTKSGVIHSYNGEFDTVMGFPFQKLSLLLQRYDII